MSFRRRVMLWLLAQAVCVAVLVTGILEGRIHLHGDISAFDQSSGLNPALDAVWSELRGRQSDRGSVLLSHQDAERATDAAIAVQAAFDARPGLAPIALAGQGAENQLFIEQLLGAFPGVMADTDRLDLEQSDGDGVLARGLAGLSVPGMDLSFTDSERDPFDLTGQALASVFGSVTPNRLIDGMPVFRSADGVFHVRVPFQTSDGSLGLERQSDLVATVRDAVGEALRENSQVSVHYLGGLFFAADIAKASRTEAQRLTLLSALWVLAVVLASMRSVRSLFATGIVLGVGLLWGGTAAALIWGGVNTVALGFAGGLLGVVADYVFHYFLARPNGNGLLARPARNALLFGALSSVVGFTTLIFASFTLLAQIAVIACAGIAAALVTILVLFPAVGLLPVRATARQMQSSTRLRLRHNRLVRVVMHPIPALALLIGCFWLLEPPSDDVRSLGHVPDALVRDAELAAELFSSAQPSRFLMVEADDSQRLLVKLEALAPSLRGLQRQGRIDSVFLISDLVPSLTRQAETAALAQRVLTQRWTQATGIPSTLSNPEPVTLEDLQNLTPRHRVLQAVHRTADGHIWAAVPVIGGTAASVTDLAARHDGVYLIDPVDEANRAFTKSRTGAQYALLVSLVLLWGLFCLRSGFAWGARQALVPTVAVIAAPVLAALVGVPLNLLTVMSLFLVLAIGADYAIFLGDPELGDHPETYRTVTLSALSSVGAFAILGTSGLPAIHQIGTMLSAGLAVAWLLSPFSTQSTGMNK